MALNETKWSNNLKPLHRPRLSGELCGNHGLSLIASLALATCAILFPMPCISGDMASELSGRWQYLQPPDEEGEILALEVSTGHWRGVMSGLERAGEHGLFYYVVELEKLSVTPFGSISFEVGERALFTRRPAFPHSGGSGSDGLIRDRMRFSGRVKDGVLILQCAFGIVVAMACRLRTLES